jgi:hypothetical protein
MKMDQALLPGVVPAAEAPLKEHRKDCSRQVHPDRLLLEGHAVVDHKVVDVVDCRMAAADNFVEDIVDRTLVVEDIHHRKVEAVHRMVLVVACQVEASHKD